MSFRIRMLLSGFLNPSTYVTQKCHICEQGLYDDHIISENICIAVQSICDKMFLCDRGAHLPHEKWEQK